MTSPVNRAVLDGLRDAAATYDSKGLLVVTLLDATLGANRAEPALCRAVYTIVRVLPLRAASGSLVHIATRDMENGIEITWETWEDPSKADKRGPTAQGLMGDLLEVALLALEDVCRAHMGVLEQLEAPVERTSSVFERGARIRRRVRARVPLDGPEPSVRAEGRGPV